MKELDNRNIEIESDVNQTLSLGLIDMNGKDIHQYEKIDNKLVFNAVTEQLGKDVEEFIKSIEKALK